MQGALHALGWGLQRLALVVGVIIVIPLIAYVLWVVAIVFGQAFGQ